MGCSSSAIKGSAPSTTSIHDDYELHEKLGQGSFGQVRVCRHRTTRQKFAVKIIDLHAARKSAKETRKEAQEEYVAWKQVGNNKHVVSLMGWHMDDCFSYFLMERCDRCVCDNLLQHQGPHLQEFELLDTFRQMLLGLQHCHSQGVIHRDIKPTNFLVGLDGLVKLCDFGLAAMEKPGGISGIAGTAPYMSPEMVLNKSYDHKTDLFSLGSTCYLMLYGTYPYQYDKNARGSAAKAMQRAIATNNPPPTYMVDVDQGLSTPSPLAKGFVKALMERDPLKRPTATEALQLPAMHKTPKPASGQRKSLTPAVQLAKECTFDFHTIDLSAVRIMDVLLERLQRQPTGGDWSRSNSLPAKLPAENASFPPTLLTRSRSHGGEISMSKITLIDDVSDCSTTASGEAGRIASI